MSTPAKGEQFYMLNSRFEVIQTVNSGSEKSRKRIACGNWFRTQEGAEKFREYVLKGSHQTIPPMHIPVSYKDDAHRIHVRVKSQYSLDTLALNFSNTMMMTALNHNSSIMEYAAMVIAAGPVTTNKQIRRIYDNFKNIEKAYEKKSRQVIDDFAKEFGSHGR